jgi:hypothetical protein
MENLKGSLIKEYLELNSKMDEFYNLFDPKKRGELNDYTMSLMSHQWRYMEGYLECLILRMELLGINYKEFEMKEE